MTQNLSLKDESENILNLINKCDQLIKKYEYSDSDTRKVVFVSIRFVSYSCLGISNLLDSLAKDDPINRKYIPAFLGMVNPIQKEIKLIGESIHKTNKLSLILLSQFQIENCISNLNSALNISVERDGFYNKADALIKYLKFSSHEMGILNTPALIRNSLHSNGIHKNHKGADFKINLNGIDYKFVHGGKVSCASLPNIANAIDCSLDIIDKIISTKEIQNIKSDIVDEYAAIIGLGKNP